MPMAHNGLAKLIEECGELCQVAGKMLAYPKLQFDDVTLHPDGTFLRDRMVDELGDVIAAVYFVAKQLNLDQNRVVQRRELKLALFNSWDKEP